MLYIVGRKQNPTRVVVHIVVTTRPIHIFIRVTIIIVVISICIIIMISARTHRSITHMCVRARARVCALNRIRSLGHTNLCTHKRRLVRACMALYYFIVRIVLISWLCYQSFCVGLTRTNKIFPVTLHPSCLHGEKKKNKTSRMNGMTSSSLRHLNTRMRTPTCTRDDFNAQLVRCCLLVILTLPERSLRDRDARAPRVAVDVTRTAAQQCTMFRWYTRAV